ncbi:carboxymuconolactone decarboxylase family protein [Pseudodesulfovibrio sp.]|uniref:carboxymuconolactone decarboxylase family protein n=1 Tax=unclassified Pseudodesulfovibrio TaxID=2661612 RepID=UPI003B00ECBF
MLESQIDLKAMIGENWGIFREQMPEVAAAYDPLHQEAYKDGAISGKNKRLMALVGGLVRGCRGCILYQTENALQLGATVEEILETITVAVSLGGTMAAGESARVIAYLREKGMLK